MLVKAGVIITACTPFVAIVMNRCKLDKFFEMIRRNPDVHADAADAIVRGCPSCELVGVEVHKQVDVRYERQSLDDIDMSGITPNIVDIEGFGVETGRALQEWDEEHSRFVAFIGADVAEKLFLGIDPTGLPMPGAQATASALPGGLTPAVGSSFVV